ncbi:MFS transporter [Lysinibacillus sp. 2017]|uniref:DHA2 family efflux MFS transporter permease subunit n=1 Tax=unclassified Lysinibacillus TaxID=2636778 RepID=UPI000D529290|nr:MULTISPECIES: DHA2 family efflux MFS transporter permease subunit [unclassified Lysinibacillus]AWE08268.1 MFS transporter [Lysinibacillus sp. 2017]TGN36229.1 DHA2 family efflux MFS transporter permease subunit [Lysinibacillus sp. S2017]
MEKIQDVKTFKKPPYLMIAVLFVGAFVAFLNNTLLNVALPSIMTAFDIKDYSTVQWLATGYMLVSGVLVPASAYLITKFRTRPLFLISMGIFVVGTALAAFAPSFGLLVTGRMIQAAGAATMSPLLMNVMLISFPVEKRGQAMGIFGLVMILAPAIGPTLSGWIVEHYDWSVLFKMILPIAIVALLLAVWKLEDVLPNRPAKIDILSLVLSTIGFGGLLYGFSTASSAGWGAFEVWGTISIGAIGLVWFIVRQFRLEEPLLDLRIYTYPSYALASVVSMVLAVAMFSGMILTPAYVQNVRGIEPFEAGLMMLPGAIVMGIMSPITGKLFDKVGPRILAVVGLAIATGATIGLGFLEVDSTYTFIITMYTIRMLGISMVMMPIMTNGLNALPNRLNPHGTAMNNTAQQVAGAIGTAVLVTIFNSHTKTRAAEIVADMKANTTPGAAQPSAEQLEQIQEQIMQQAMLDGITYSFFIAAGVTVIALIIALFLKRVDITKREDFMDNTKEK